MSALWDGRAEDAGAVARRTAATLQRLEFLCPPDGWRYPDGNVWGMWPTGPREQARWVESKMFTSQDGDPEPMNGYSFSLSQEANGLTVELSAKVGGSSRGGRLPVNRVSCVLWESVPGGFKSAVVDPIVEAVVEVWEPLATDFWDRAVLDIARPSSAWQVVWGYRIWVHDSVGSITQAAPGVHVSRLGSGTLLSTPDEWTTQRVVEAMRETLSRNGIDEVPH